MRNVNQNANLLSMSKHWELLQSLPNTLNFEVSKAIILKNEWWIFPLNLVLKKCISSYMNGKFFINVSFADQDHDFSIMSCQYSLRMIFLFYWAAIKQNPTLSWEHCRTIILERESIAMISGRICILRTLIVTPQIARQVSTLCFLVHAYTSFPNFPTGFLFVFKTNIAFILHNINVKTLKPAIQS